MNLSTGNLPVEEKKQEGRTMAASISTMQCTRMSARMNKAIRQGHFVHMV